MSDVNMNRVQFGCKIEAVNGTAETLVDADFNVEVLDQELVQMAPDKSSAGKVANGTLANTGTEYTRTNGGTVAIKMEIKKADDPTIKPNYFKVLELAGFVTDTYDDGGSDKWQATYAGVPNCNTGTFVTTAYDCAGNRYQKSLAGAIITGGKLAFDGLGAPLMFDGTITGKFLPPTYPTTAIVSTVDAGDAIQHTGTVNLIGSTPYNLTKMEAMTNTTATMIPNSGDVDGTNIGYYRFGEGDPTGTFGASPLGDEITDYDDYASNVIHATLVTENDDFILTQTGVQFTNIQDTNESGALVQEKELQITSIKLQLK